MNQTQLDKQKIARKKEREFSLDEQYKKWLSKNKLTSYAESKIKIMDETLTKEILKEIKLNTGIENQSVRMLKHKYEEVNQQLKNYSPELLEELRQKCWVPNDKSDYRRIIPEMILISDRIKIDRKDIFGLPTHDTFEHQTKLSQDWTSLSVCTSKARNDNVPGRKLRYIVRDRVTKKYLGIICITGTLPNLKPRNIEFFRANNIKKYFQQGGVIGRNMANGQKIVATQPFGTLFNGGKLLSLLCCSDVVANDWKTKFGDVLVSVDTTSLYGGKQTKGAGGETQYDGLRPIWWYAGDTLGKDTPYKPEDILYSRMNSWLQLRYPLDWFKINKAKTKNGQNFVREPKNNVINTVFRKLSIKKLVKKLNMTTSNEEKRGVYISRLYKNTDEFLRGEIKENELVPAFNNSVKFLSELWKYGYDGDTKSYVNPEIKNLLDELKNKIKDIQNEVLPRYSLVSVEPRVSAEKRGSAKKRLRSNLVRNLDSLIDDPEVKKRIIAFPQRAEYYSRKLKIQTGISNRLSIEGKWYGFMRGKSWAQVKAIYADELVSRKKLKE